MDCSSTMTSTTVDQGGGTVISAVHPDVLHAHILTRLDGPTLAAASCASSLLHTLSTEENLWRDICRATWPSTGDPRVRHLISTFLHGHRSFFSDSFPLLHHRTPSQADPPRPSSPPSELISAVDIHYQNKLVLSKVTETEAATGWFRCSPFRIDLLEHKESVPIPVKFASGDDSCQWQLEDNLTLSWIVIDPTRNRAANLSSWRPVSVQRHWLSGDVQVRYATVVAGDGSGSSSELVQCGVVVTCGVEEGGEVHMREVSMQLEDMEGRNLSGKESLVILQEAILKGKRKMGKRGEEREQYEEYVAIRKDRRETKQRRERRLDRACMGVGFTIFVVFLWFMLLR